MIVCLPNAVAPQRGRPPLPKRKRIWRPRADASRPTTTNSSAGDRDGDFPVSTTLASISSGLFASTYGAVVPVLLHWSRQRPELARFSAHGRFRPARPAGSLAGTSRAATGEDFLAPSGLPRHERSAKGRAKHEPAPTLLSCYALVRSNSVIPLSPRGNSEDNGRESATGEDFLASGLHERSAKGRAKHEPAPTLLSCYVPWCGHVIPLSPRTRHFLMGLRRQRYWESFPQAATLLLSGTRPEGADTGLGAGGQARRDNFEGGKCAMSIRQGLADR